MKSINHVMMFILVVSLIASAFLITPQGLADSSLEAKILKQVAHQQGLPLEDLVIGDLVELNFPQTGVTVYQAKVVDRTTGEVYGLAVNTDAVIVDLPSVKTAELNARQGLYGKLAPALYQEFQETSDASLLEVGIWLKGEIQSTRPELPTPTPDDLGPVLDDNSDSLVVQDGEKTIEQVAKAVATRAKEISGSQAALDAASYNASQANTARLAAQVAALEAPLLADLQTLGYEPTYTSPYAPLVYVRMSKTDILELAQKSYIDTIYGPNQYQDLMDSAKSTQKANIVDNLFGFDGTGVNVAILEDSRIEFANPYLVNGVTRVPGDGNVDDHATATAGMVASQHATYQGIAQGAALFSANATSYTDPNLSAAMDWAVAQDARTINNSWGGNAGTTDLNVHDRHLDYIVRNNWRTVVVAAGNEGGTTSRVTSPARGYNVISVGNHTDQNNTNWADDVMNSSSSYVDPITGVEKPEVAAVGTSINSTTMISPWVGNVGSGTSYSSPMVSGEAALLMERNGGLKQWPEVVKAIIMASALHNIEGDTRLSEQDGAGGVDMRAAFRIADEGWIWGGSIDTTFVSYAQYFTAYAGERVRAAIAWDSNPAGDYSTDPLQADIDLKVYDAAENPVAFSTSISNSFEVVEFTASATQQYKLEVVKFTMSNSTYIGLAWWRGMSVLTSYAPQVWGTPPVSRDYFRVSPALYWSAIGIRNPAENDYDVYLYSHSAFDSPSDYTWLEDSTTTQTVDYVVIDRNHAPSQNYYLEVGKYTGSGGNYTIQYAAHSADTAVQSGVFGPYTMGTNDILRVWDAYLTAGRTKCFKVDITSGNGDLGMRLFDSNPATPSTMFQGKSQAVKIADANGAGGDESFCYVASVSDWYGLVVENNGQTSNTTFKLVVTEPVYLPLVR